MNYVNKMWIAASVAVAQSHTEQGQLKSGLRSLQLTRRRLSSSASSGGGDSSAGVRSLAGASAVGSGVAGFVENCEEKVRQADESLQKVMYLSCWGQG